MSGTFPGAGCGAPRVAIIGAGPIGLEAALTASWAGFPFTVYEAAQVGGHVQRWGHVRLFTPFAMNRSEAGRRAILDDRPSFALPDAGACISGFDYVEGYLLPLSRTRRLRDHIRTKCRVVALTRSGLLKHERVNDPKRAGVPFRLLIEGDGGDEQYVEAEIVIDASGVYGRPNPVGAGGALAPGERRCAEWIRYGLDDITGCHRELYAGKRTVLIGAGYSAATSIVALRRLVEEEQATQVLWLTRGNRSGPVPEIENDRLAERRSLAEQANAIATRRHPRITHVSGMGVEQLEPTGSSAVRVHFVDAAGERRVFEADRILANTGFRPDRSLYEELQVHECYATQGPMKLAAALMGQAAADCLDRAATGSDTLRNPEPNFFIIGAKSYGRDSTFLIQNGLVQVRQVFDLLRERWSTAPRAAAPAELQTTGTG